jgi:hypothetical protein
MMTFHIEFTGSADSFRDEVMKLLGWEEAPDTLRRDEVLKILSRGDAPQDEQAAEAPKRTRRTKAELAAEAGTVTAEVPVAEIPEMPKGGDDLPEILKPPTDEDMKTAVNAVFDVIGHGGTMALIRKFVAEPAEAKWKHIPVDQRSAFIAACAQHIEKGE